VSVKANIEEHSFDTNW